MIAYDYPLLGMFWTMLIFFFWVAWIMILFRIIADIFRSHDMGGIAKAAWLLFVIAIPWLGALVYLIARGNSMAQRSIEQHQAQQAAFDSYVRETAGSTNGSTTSSADELAKLADLRDRGVITATEFADQKAKVLV